MVCCQFTELRRSSIEITNRNPADEILGSWAANAAKQGVRTLMPTGVGAMMLVVYGFWVFAEVRLVGRRGRIVEVRRMRIVLHLARAEKTTMPYGTLVPTLSQRLARLTDLYR